MMLLFSGLGLVRINDSSALGNNFSVLDMRLLLRWTWMLLFLLVGREGIGSRMLNWTRIVIPLGG